MVARTLLHRREQVRDVHGAEGKTRGGAWITVPIAGEDTAAALSLARRARDLADAVEFRLDLMTSIDLPHLLADAPLPAVVTCRPIREGGRYCFDEEARLALLRDAAALGAALVDVEWDAAEQLGSVSPARRIVSRHIFDHTPDDLDGVYRRLLDLEPDVVKIATYAHTLEDALRVVALLARAERPTIAIAMGEAGLLSRLIAGAFPAAFLTFVALDEDHIVAPGQVTLREMRQRYHGHRVRPGTRVFGLLSADANASPFIAATNRRWAEEGVDAVLLPLQPTPADEEARVRALCEYVGIHVVSGPEDLP